MTDEEHSDSRTEDDYEEGEEAYDDEGTLDEEEMLSPEENYQDELKMLEDDANLSIEELKRKYCNAEVVAAEEEEYDDTQSTSDDISDDAQKSAETDNSGASPDASEADTAGPSSVSPKKELKEHGYFSDVDDNEEDADYVPPDPWRRNVRQGPIYQATVPDSISSEPGSPREERETLLWSPYAKIPMKKVEEYLKDCYSRAAQAKDPSFLEDTRRSGNINRNFPLKDDEDALKALLDAKYNTNAALANHPFSPANAPLRSVGLNSARWTDEDCDLFEQGMQVYGKNFHAIKQLLPHRTVGEIVHFYYIWKKTERHDMYEERIRDAKHHEHPNCTDFMGGLIEHMDATTGANALDIAPNAIPANVDLIAGKEWRECWPNSEGATLPDLDSDTIANVLQ